MRKKLNRLSVFFPLFNEEGNVIPLVEKALLEIPNLTNEYEIILVNDGSTDATLKIALEIAEKNERVKVVSQENRGYGGALKTGFDIAKYEWVFYSDGDLQFELGELQKLIEHTEENDLIIGYRKSRAEGFKRELITWLLKVWNKLSFDFPSFIKDTDCAFKLIKKEVLNKVLPLQSNGGLISTELLLKAYNLDFKFAQVPVTHKKRQYGNSTGDSSTVIKKAVRETVHLLNIFPERKKFLMLNFAWFGVLLLLFPVALRVNYMQNDEYTHYRMVAQFLNFDFTLDPYLGSTFYTQGLLGMVFANLFGIGSMPVLTLLISIGAVWLLSIILYTFFEVKVLPSFLTGLFIFVNPLFLYSSWGFMSENYFIFFLAASLWSYYSFARKPTRRKFIITNLLFFLSYGVRQFGLFTPLAASLDLFYKRKYKWSFVQFAVFIFFVLFHFFVFPQTPQMYDGRLSLSNLNDVDGVVTRIYIFGIYISVFLAPFIVSFIYRTIRKNPKIFVMILLSVFLFWFFEKKFEPENIKFTLRTREGETNYEVVSPKFPYLENIFTRKGVFEDNLPGDKYIFPGYFDLFGVLELSGKWLFVLFLAFVFVNLKKIEKMTLFYSLIFIGILLISPRLFDRYLLPVVISGLIMIVSLMKFSSERFSMTVLIFTLVFWLFLGYQFTADFMLVNRYIWSESQKISETENVPKNKISADHSWRQLYPNESRDRIYHFTYKAFDRAKEGSNYSLVSSFKIDYPFNFYKDSFVYLYFNKGAVDD
ncbi:MAG: glycosyl transferase family protein [uncultured bacterium]|nr:MAG: glycosyl transferase family protein [uncultured bacterium]